MNKPLPPPPPKMRCIANDQESQIQVHKEVAFLAKAWTVAAVMMIFLAFSSWLLVPDPRLDPKRTDHAVQAGIRECERTLPRTQTCELSQLSFKVVEKKGW